jgi:hypothetical protein
MDFRILGAMLLEHVDGRVDEVPDQFENPENMRRYFDWLAHTRIPFDISPRC